MIISHKHSSAQPQSTIDWPGCARKLSWQIRPQDALARFVHLEKSILLQSDRLHAKLGRYSYLMAEPFEWLELPCDSREPLRHLEARLSKFPTSLQSDLPPMQGGAAGFLSYDLNRSFEAIKPPQTIEFPLPGLAFGLYDTVVAWDHLLNETWIISQGFPETDFRARRARAKGRLEFFEELLAKQEPPHQPTINSAKATTGICTQYPCKQLDGLTSNFSCDQYQAMIDRAIEYIYAGDVYQVNLAQRLLTVARSSSLELYRQLCRVNPAPFSGWFDLGETQILSCSPERLASVRDRQVETRPIKGTRKRTRFPEVDLNAKAELESSVKDRAENVMIVDLMRNDLSRVCEDESIHVRQLLETEAYESVLHLVSSIEGRLRDDCSCIDLLESIFPGGSITGAPKIRAMEIIAELEPAARGAYCGSLGYLGFNGDMDFNILIRTITASRGYWQIPVGGGIVAQSNPAAEYEETWTKAAGMLQAIVSADALENKANTPGDQK